jgi:glycogen synthase
VRILAVGNMYPPHHLGGAELIWRSATHHHRRRGHVVRILTTDFALEAGNQGIDEDPDVHRELRWYWHDHRFPRLGPLRRLRIERHNARVLGRHLQAFAPDAVVWWSMGGMSLGLLARVREAGLPAVGVLLDDWLVYAPQVDGWQRLCRRLGALGPAVARLAGSPAVVDLGSCAHWVFMSETVRRHAAEAGVRIEDSTVAYRGIDSGEFSPRPPRRWQGELVYVGRIDPRKGIANAIRSLAALPDERLSVVGDGDPEHLGELRALAGELGVEARVEFKRVRRGEVPEVMAAADALLFPVLWEEPWGLVPLEAMAAGTPVIASGRGGSGEYLRHAQNCLLFEPADDFQALAAAVRDLRNDADLRAHLRAGGLRTVASFSAESFNDAVLAAVAEAPA